MEEKYNDNSLDENKILEEDSCHEEMEGILRNWIMLMENKVSSIIKNEIGDDLSPRHCPKVVKRLIDHMKTIPVWSCIRRDNFKYGRVPASSASVECEFKIIKNQIFTREVRLDTAIETIVKYYDGKLKLIDCSIQKENTKHVKDATEEIQNLNNILPSEEIKINRSPFKDLSVIYNIQQKKVCSICENEELHPAISNCFLCEANIHLLDSCSTRLEEEGKENKRICQSCYRSSTKNSRLALNEIENWRGLGEPKKKKQKKSIYLSKEKNDLIDFISSDKLRKLPIIKNGSTETLRLVSLGKATFSLYNTCPLDTLFQIFLAAVSDSKEIKNFVEEQKSKNPLFEMVLEVDRTRIQVTTYKKRAQIFLQYLNKTPEPNIIESVNCACNIVSLANFLFKNNPSFVESLVCPAGCKERIKFLPTITITERELKKPLENVIRDHVILPGVKCRHPQCEKVEENSIREIGKYPNYNFILNNYEFKPH